MTLNELFKNTTYDDTLFSVEAKSTIESRIFMKSVRGSEVPYITIVNRLLILTGLPMKKQSLHGSITRC